MAKIFRHRLAALTFIGFLFVIIMAVLNISMSSLSLLGRHGEVTGLPKETDFLSLLDHDLPNLPLSLLITNEYREKRACGNPPYLKTIRLSSFYWQEFKTSNGTFYLYAAYLDARKMNKDGPSIRITAILEWTEPINSTFCHVWFEKDQQEPVIIPVAEHFYLWPPEYGPDVPDTYHPYMMTCRLPAEYRDLVPIAVSVVERECDNATNLLKVSYEKLQPGETNKGKIAVCSKLLRFPYDNTAMRLVEAIELYHLVGGGKLKLFYYVWEAHENASKVLDYYEKKGMVGVKQMLMPGHKPSLRELLHIVLSKDINEKLIGMIPYHDCLYRNMYQYEYFAVVDIDEIIMPRERPDLPAMMEDAEEDSIRKNPNDPVESYCFESSYFLPEMMEKHMPQDDKELEKIPSHLHAMRHIYRSVSYPPPGHNMKSMHRTDTMVFTHTHFSRRCLSRPQGCTSYGVNTSRSHMHHYKFGCPDCVEHLRENVTRDTTIWRFKKEMLERTERALKDMGFIGKV